MQISQPKNSVRSPYKTDWLLVLRGVLAFTVVLHHWEFGVSLAKVFSFDPIRILTITGSVAVFIFFVLSGYLMHKILDTKYQGRKCILNFYFNRYTRITPVYLLAVLAGAVAALRLISPGEFISIFFYAINYDSSSIIYELNRPLWTIATEMQFYLAAPLIYVISNSPKFKSKTSFVIELLLFSIGLRFFYFFYFGETIVSKPVVYRGLGNNLLHFLTGWLAYSFKPRLPKTDAKKAFNYVLLMVLVLWILHYLFV
jgi:peptidoglycan/LPS O-acetylase OafA/YrhL